MTWPGSWTAGGHLRRGWCCVLLLLRAVFDPHGHARCEQVDDQSDRAGVGELELSPDDGAGSERREDARTAEIWKMGNIAADSASRESA